MSSVNPRTPLRPAPGVLKAPAPRLQSQCHLETFVDSKLSHSENQDPPVTDEGPRWWHAPPAGEGQDGHKGAVCVLPRLYAGESPPHEDTQGAPPPGPCVCPVPTTPWAGSTWPLLAAQLPRSPAPTEEAQLHGPVGARGPVHPPTVSETRKAVTASQHRANASLQVQRPPQDAISCCIAGPGKGCRLGWAQAGPGTTLTVHVASG